MTQSRLYDQDFYAWANVVLPSATSRGGNIAYIDLYAGPGRYKDGAASTPLMVLESVIKNPKFAKSVVTYFNDADPNNVSTLKSEIEKLADIGTLKNKPIVNCGEVDDDAASFFNATKLIPSFSFVDPFGYKGLSLSIVRGVIKDWGCDCIFFFNYSLYSIQMNL